MDLTTSSTNDIEPPLRESNMHNPSNMPHLQTAQPENASGLYTCQEDLWTLHLYFQMPGKATREVFHNWLRAWGKIPPFSSSAFAHGHDELLHLQADFWREQPSSSSIDYLDTTRHHDGTIAHRWKDAQAVSQHIQNILYSLERKTFTPFLLFLFP